MPEKLTQIQMEKVLGDCTDSHSPDYEKSCCRFISRYKGHIYKIAYLECLGWNKRRTRRELEEIVNDIVAEVIYLLFSNNAHVLRKFDASHSEIAFLGYLATISRRMAVRWLRKHYTMGNGEKLLKTAAFGINQDALWQIFDYIVATLRIKTSGQERHMERNILIFNLYILEEFSKPMLAVLPIFRKQGSRVVDNVISRCREKFSQEDKKTLREIRF